METDEVSHAYDDDVSTPFVASLNSDIIPQQVPLSTNFVKEFVGEGENTPVVSSTLETPPDRAVGFQQLTDTSTLSSVGELSTCSDSIKNFS